MATDDKGDGNSTSSEVETENEPSGEAFSKEDIIAECEEKISSEIDRFEGKLNQFISLFKWSAGIFITLVLTIVGLGWMIIEDRAPADAKQRMAGLSTHSCRALIHGVDARQRLLSEELRSFQGQATQLEQQISDIPGRSQWLQSAITNLEQTVADLSSDIGEIQSKLGTQQGQAEKYRLEAELAKIEEQHTRNTEELGRLKLELSQLPQTSSELSASLSNLQDRLTTAQSEYENLATESDGCRSRIGKP